MLISAANANPQETPPLEDTNMPFQVPSLPLGIVLLGHIDPTDYQAVTNWLAELLTAQLLWTQGGSDRRRGEGIGDQCVFVLKLRKEGFLCYTGFPYMHLYRTIT
jgi:hypothetical protein